MTGLMVIGGMFVVVLVAAVFEAALGRDRR